MGMANHRRGSIPGRSPHPMVSDLEMGQVIEPDPVKWLLGNPYDNPWYLILAIGVLLSIIAFAWPNNNRRPYWRTPRRRFR